MHLDSRYKCIRPCVNRVAIVRRQQFVDHTGVLEWKTSEAEKCKDCWGDIIPHTWEGSMPLNSELEVEIVGFAHWMQVGTGSAAFDRDVIPTNFEGFDMEWLSDIANELKGKT